MSILENEELIRMLIFGHGVNNSVYYPIALLEPLRAKALLKKTGCGALYGLFR